MGSTYPGEEVDGEARFLMTRSLDVSSGMYRIHKRVSPLGNMRVATTRLTHEAATLVHLKGVTGVPEVLWFDADQRELVMWAVGGQLLEDCAFGLRLPWADFVLIAINILRILDAIHGRGVVHLDLSPRRIRVFTEPDRNPELFNITLTGFSHAVVPGIHGDFTKEGALATQIAYSSPEQTGRMNRGIDHRSDLYSLGVVLYELACGQLPFAGADPLALVHAHLARLPSPAHVIRPDVPMQLSRILERMLRKAPEHRPDSAADLIADFESLGRSLAVDRIIDRDAGTPAPFAVARRRATLDPVEIAEALLRSFDTAERIETAERTLADARALAAFHGDASGLTSIDSFSRFLDVVKNGPAPLGRLRIDERSPGTVLAISIENLFRCLAAVFHRDSRALAAFSFEPLDKALPDGSYLRGAACFAYCMALLGQLDMDKVTSPTDEVDPERAATLERATTAWERLAVFAEEEGRPFGTLLALTRGLLEEARGEHWAASRHMDVAMTSIRETTRSWHRAMVLEHNGRFYARYELTRVALRVLERAISVYQRWGADKRVVIMAAEFPFLSLMQPTVSDPDAPVWTSAADRQAILLASQALSSETDLTRLVVRMTEVIEQLAGATAVGVFFRHDTEGWLLAGARRDGEAVNDLPARAEDASRWGFARSVVDYALECPNAELIGDAMADSRFSGDPEFAQADCCSVLFMPITTKGAASALLLVENRLSAGFFTGKDLDTLGLIAGTLSTSIENALIYRSLEQRVVERTRELAHITATLILRDQALENSTNGVMICEIRGTASPIIYVNAMFEKITGFTSEDVIGQDPRFLHRGDADQPEVEELARAIAGRRSCKVVLRNYRSDGSMFFNEVAIAPVAGPDGVVTHFVGSQVDVTDRLQREASDRRKTERLAAVFDLSPDGFVVIDKDARISIVNPAFEHLTGLRAMRLIGQPLGFLEDRLGELMSAGIEPAGRDSDFIDPDPANDAPLVPAPRRAPSRPGQIRIESPQPRTLVRSDSKGDAPGGETVISFRDITRELEIDEKKNRILSTAAHQLRTPMQSIIGFTELVLTRELDKSQRDAMLGIIHQQTSSLVDMINDVLDLARLDAKGQADFHFEVLPIEPIVTLTIDALAGLGHGREVRLEPTATPALVRVDKEKLVGAITNVLSNALKYSTRGPIVVSVLHRDHRGRAEVGVRVTDQGIGMSPEQLTRLFERFFRVDTSGRIPGTGLGTSLAKEVIELHDGELLAESALGVGTSMTAWLPVVELPSDPAVGHSKR